MYYTYINNIPCRNKWHTNNENISEPLWKHLKPCFKHTVQNFADLCKTLSDYGNFGIQIITETSFKNSDQSPLIYSQAITARGGVFLESPVVGSRVPALEGQLIVLAAGDRKLYDDCFSCFEAIGKKSLYLGKFWVQSSNKMYINDY